MKRILLITILSIFFPLLATAKVPVNHRYFEKDYQNVWCSDHFGTLEVILADKARVDCVTETHAIEFDFAKKWAESIGQSLYYAEALHKSPGIVLIIEDREKDQKYTERVKSIADKSGITLWLMYPEDMEK